ncbi:MAG: UDP-N-acetylglucosamine 2-epimerase (non-hydrolyzing) [Acidobacteria bacterium]|nr:UDP-N-acetylglucosamine 2-epimerase (non-hydrolyzing) [Acidobacteriota bacterium]
MIKVLNVVGARPNFMKMAPIIRAMTRRETEVSQLLVHTGQHYDDSMSASFFRDLEISEPDIHLDIRSASHAEQTARIMLSFERVLVDERPDWVVVVGDVNSTLACALVAAKLDVQIAHVEAGLRSFDRSMPEEINRVLTDRLSDLLFTPSADADANLIREGIDPLRIARVGNVMIDTLYQQLERSSQSRILERLGLLPGEFAVLTLHRPVNVDTPASLERIFHALDLVSREVPVVFPVHPRTQAKLNEFRIDPPPGMHLLEPLGYLDFLKLWSNSVMVLTDSGGIQEETTALGIPCLTLRENTERPITIEEGTNQLVGTHPDRIVSAARSVLSKDRPARPRTPEFWDGYAAERIVDALLTDGRRIPESPARVNLCNDLPV